MVSCSGVKEVLFLVCFQTPDRQSPSMMRRFLQSLESLERHMRTDLGDRNGRTLRGLSRWEFFREFVYCFISHPHVVYGSYPGAVCRFHNNEMHICSPDLYKKIPITDSVHSYIHTYNSMYDVNVMYVYNVWFNECIIPYRDVLTRLHESGEKTESHQCTPQNCDTELPLEFNFFEGALEAY